jgi:predicted ATPase
MVEQPSGTVTLVFTDIEGSTRLLYELGQDAYQEALAEHRRIVREACAHQAGYEVDCEGDSFFYAFSSALQAVAAVEYAMRAHESSPFRIRVGVHTGEPGLDPPKYVGMDVHKAARIMSAAHGGQVLMSENTYGLVEVEARDLGLHRLKDLSVPQRLYQLGQAEFPPPRTLQQTNLPVPDTPLIGREQELRELSELLSGDEARLITMTGTGGTGKTRLALYVTGEVAGLYPEGVWWVPLAPVTEPELVPAAIAAALSVREQPGELLLGTLVRVLQSGRRLLLIDNLEHLLGAASVVSTLLSRCEGLTLLVTSRARLHLRGEHEYPLAPLPLPDASADADLAALAACPSVALLVERAAALDPSFSLGHGNAADLAEICVRLDGLPLALELAAPWLKLLPPAVLRERLQERLPLLARGGHDVDSRQQTLRATIDWSYRLLDPEERQLFARLAVFSGGCRLDDVAPVCGEGQADPLFLLAALVDASLVRRDGERLTMLETIREYALERLQESGEVEQIRDLHAESFVQLAEGRADQVGDPPLPLLAPEQPNMRAALGWLAEQGDEGRRLRLAVALARFWLSAGSGAEGLAQLEGALVAAPAAPTELRARALLAAARIALNTGDYERTVSAAKEALELFRASGDERGAAAALRLTAGGLHLGGNRAATSALLEESLALARKAGDSVLTSMALIVLSAVAQEEGDDLRAYELVAEGRALLKAQPTRELGEIVVAAQFGNVAFGLGRYDEAEAAYQESLLLARQLGAEGDAAIPLVGLAALRAQDGNAGQAAELLGAIERIFEETGSTFHAWERDLRERTLAEVRARLGDAESAAALARGRALDLDQVIGLVTGDRDPLGEGGSRPPSPGAR